VKIDIRQLSKEEIKEFFISSGEPAFRAKQVYEWLWKKSCTDFDGMTNLSKDLRDKLKAHFEIKTIETDKTQISLDGTIKFRFKLYDDAFIESVLIPVPDDKRFTVCISCQVGCSLSCKFCATGQMKRIRNLDPGEVYDQVVQVNNKCLDQYGHGITNIVYMGMGEPLLTYQNMMKSIHYITSDEGLGMSPRRITVSTAGIAKMIKKLADDQVRFNLALSLHAADDAKRNEIMPINEQNDLASLLDSLKYFYLKTGNKISYEYIAFQGFNDGEEDARRLVRLCKHFPVTVNVIEYNPIDGFDMVKSDEDRLNKFARIVRDNGIMITVRTSRGKDIDAACGQLANKD
jgi:23S rRNA (adenine2503-C2)-methyltransferase